MIVHELPDDALSKAILRTVIYADVFNFPMTAPEIHHFLIGVEASRDQVQTLLIDSRWLLDRLDCRDGYYALRGRGAIVDERAQRTAYSAALWPIAQRYGARLGRLPFVRMVALTGALAMQNAHGADDDIDYLVVTQAGRVWMARAFMVIMVRLAKLRGVRLCPNYVLAESALVQQSHDLYLAHEVAQMVPIAGLALYTQLRDQNGWVADHLPNADGPFYPLPDARIDGPVKTIGEALFGGALGARLERWEQSRKLRRFAPQVNAPHSSAQLDATHVKGHFNDYGYPALNNYQRRLIELGLTVSPAEKRTL